jgi:hypothetical protein
MNINAVIQPAGFVLPVSLQLFDMLMVEAGEKPLVNIALPPLRSISGTRTTARSGAAITRWKFGWFTRG